MANALFIPLSWGYKLGVAIRHMLFNQHILPSFSVPVPTICVGNLAVGGTGKTPMTEYLVQLMLDNGYHPAVLSRGYKRATRGFRLADARRSSDWNTADSPERISYGHMDGLCYGCCS